MPRGIPNPNPSGPPSRKALAVLRKLRAGHVDSDFNLQIQNALLRRGLIEWSETDYTYHITPAGEALLDSLDGADDSAHPSPNSPLRLRGGAGGGVSGLRANAQPHNRIVAVHPLPPIIPDGDGSHHPADPSLSPSPRVERGPGGEVNGNECPPDCPYRMAVDLLSRLGLISARGLVADLENLRRQLQNKGL